MARSPAYKRLADPVEGEQCDDIQEPADGAGTPARDLVELETHISHIVGVFRC